MAKGLSRSGSSTSGLIVDACLDIMPALWFLHVKFRFPASSALPLSG